MVNQLNKILQVIIKGTFRRENKLKGNQGYK